MTPAWHLACHGVVHGALMLAILLLVAGMIWTAIQILRHL